jgi:O-methyltransferase
MINIKDAIKNAIRRAGYELCRIPHAAPIAPQASQFLPDEPEWIREIFGFVQPFTMTSPERIATLCHAVEYLDRNEIEGDIVECGVWRGGSVISPFDVCSIGAHSIYTTRLKEWQNRVLRMLNIRQYLQKRGWRRMTGFHAKSSLDEVRRNLASTAYPFDRVKLIVGKVEDAIPSSSPDRIALLRLDTDWYESTKHELSHLRPRLVR